MSFNYFKLLQNKQQRANKTEYKKIKQNIFFLSNRKMGTHFQLTTVRTEREITKNFCRLLIFQFANIKPGSKISIEKILKQKKKEEEMKKKVCLYTG